MLSTIKFIKSMHLAILSNLNMKLKASSDISPLIFRCDFQEFANSLHKSDMASVGTTFCHMLRSVKGIGKETVQKVNARFKTFNQMYTFLNSPTRNHEEIKRFLDILHKDQVRRFVIAFIQLNPEQFLE